MELNENARKDLKVAKALSIFEGACFFVAGICALLAGSVIGYISGGLLIILACANMYAAIMGGDTYYVNLGMSLVEDDDAEQYGMRVEESKNENANG